MSHFKNKEYFKAMSHIYLHLEDCCFSNQGMDVLGKLKEKSKKKHHKLNEEMNSFKDIQFNTNNSMDRMSYSDKVYIGGTTAISALICDNKIYLSNLGDSRAIIVEKDKNANKPRVVLATKDHKPDNREEKRRIENANG